MKNPTINILTRTSKRPNYFKSCVESISQQTYKNINHIVASDDKDSLEYVKLYNIDPLYIDPKKYKHNNYKLFDYQKVGSRGESPAWWNSYFNDMYSFLKEGWVMYLDDDDSFSYSDSLEVITPHLTNPSNLIFWKVQFPGYTIPRKNSPSLQTNPPQPANISSIGLMFHTQYIDHAYWEPWGGGDYRLATNLWNIIPNKIEINHTLTHIQDTPHLGNQQDKPLP